jgi:hypothetical protein
MMDGSGRWCGLWNIMKGDGEKQEKEERAKAMLEGKGFLLFTKIADFAVLAIHNAAHIFVAKPPQHHM